MGAKRRRGNKAPGVTPVKVEQGMFITIGVPEGKAGKLALKRAAEILQRSGYRCGVTSPEAILAAADLINKDQEQLAEQAAEDAPKHPSAAALDGRLKDDPESGDTDGRDT